MSADLDPRDELTDRLAALGRRPVDPALQSEHLTALAGVRTGSAFRTSLAGRLKVAAGVMAGFLIGATGLTTAGAMGPFQPIAATMVESATPLKGLPKSASDKAKAKGLEKAAKNKGKGAEAGEGAGGEKIWGVDGCPADGEFKNRGQFLKAAKENDPAALMSFEKARQSDCGKGVGATGTADEAETDKTGDDATQESKRQNDAGNGASEGKGDADEAGKSADAGKSGDAGKPEPTGKPEEPGTKPDSVPAPPAQQKADDHAQLPTGAPGAPADDRPAVEPTDSDV
jgi:hypothetical protein